MPYYLNRLIQMIVVLSILSFVVFIIIDKMPGDPAQALAVENPGMKKEDLIALKIQMGYIKKNPNYNPKSKNAEDRKKYLKISSSVRYLYWTEQVLGFGLYQVKDPSGQLVEKFHLTWRFPIVKSESFPYFKFKYTGSLGYSINYKRQVTDMLGPRIISTLKLTIPVIILALSIALPLGIYAAIRQYSPYDYTVNMMAFIGFSVPTFIMGIMAIYFFSQKLNLFPPAGLGTPGVSGWLDDVKYLVLPVMVLGFYDIGNWLRYIRGSVLEVLKQDYVRTARAKGLSEDIVIIKHAVRNAIMPLVTLMALSIPVLFSGALVTEQIFGLPGMGKLLFESVVNKDSNVAMAAFLFIAMLTLLFNFLADILYTIVDPRVRVKGRSGR
ncbi:MAG: ABC transporter permease [Spirochaetota bacterium]|nr:ABC transporter permease [Spirochaetota bacterium]